ncbi:hypothetical protein B7C42_01357 [Nocardia cerradoensis]|uniref:Glycosyltransferase RgtA/B/C/D-like domain-containing protein n=1 Tax=Nocardia cerradoensis TaxID=85688 RepID=A0A231HBY1_9NOCA|nr:hypothetical protein [Nocardia cerradoensis]OXR46391.1 hypothetical protein B7C42_01357 [Nocardia cerradoensis]
MFSAPGFARGWAPVPAWSARRRGDVRRDRGRGDRSGHENAPTGAVAEIASSGTPIDSTTEVAPRGPSAADSLGSTRAVPRGFSGLRSTADFAGLRAVPHRPVLLVAVLLILAQIALRGWVAGRGYFYWDDLILVGRADRYPLWSADLLLYDHDGHFMPLAFVTAWVVTRIAPLQWAGPVVTMLLLQLAASVAVLRMLLVLVPRRAGAVRWAVLVPLIGYLFCPLTLPAFAWWAASLNALPLQFALAWVIADAVLLVRTGRGRYAVSGVLVLIVGLLFFEKAVVVPFVAFAVAVLERYVVGARTVDADSPAGEAESGPRDAAAPPEDPERAGDRGGPSVWASTRDVARTGAALWAGSALILAGWGAAYLTVADHIAVDTSLAGARRLLHSATSLGILPTLLGGPWVWARWLPSTPWATPPGWTVVPAWAILAAVVLVTLRLRRRVLPVWILVVGYVLAVQLPIVLIRGGPNTAAELMQSLRYLADVAVVLAAATALLLAARPRTRSRNADALGPTSPGPVPAAHAVAIVLTAAFVVSSVCTTVSFARSWEISPTRTYLTNARAAFADRDGAPLLEQEVPWGVLTPMTYPQNLIAQVLGPIAPDGAFGTSTPHLRMITDDGELVDASVWWNRRILAGPEPGCGYRVDGSDPVALWLDGPMIEHGWTAQLNYFANQDGHLTVAMEHGDAVVVPVRAGVHTVFVHVVGSGEVLRIGSRTSGLDVCVGVGPVGVAAFGH